MENIIEQIANGAPFTIKLKERNLYLNGKAIIKKGEFMEDLGEYADTQVTQELLEDTYLRFMYSSYEKDLPRRYPFHKMEDRMLLEEDMICGDKGHLQRFWLEFTLLIGLINGSIQWLIDDLNNNNHFFWKSNRIPQFVIFKSTIC